MGTDPPCSHLYEVIITHEVVINYTMAGSRNLEGAWDRILGKDGGFPFLSMKRWG